MIAIMNQKMWFKYEAANGEKYILNIPSDCNVPVYCRSTCGKFIECKFTKHEPSALSMNCVEGDLLYIVRDPEEYIVAWFGYEYEKCGKHVDKLEDLVDVHARELNTLSIRVDTLRTKLTHMDKYVKLLLVKDIAANYWHKLNAKCRFVVETEIIGTGYISVTLYIYNINELTSHEQLREFMAGYETDLVKLETLYIMDEVDEVIYNDYLHRSDNPLIDVIRSIILDINIFPNLRHLEIGRAPEHGYGQFKQPYLSHRVGYSQPPYTNRVKNCDLTRKHLEALRCGKLKTIKLGMLYGMIIMPQSNLNAFEIGIVLSLFMEKNITLIIRGTSVV